MPEGKNRADPQGRISSEERMFRPSIHPPKVIRKGRRMKNPGAGPASVADMDQLRRGRHSPVIERRKKGIKNVKRQVSEKRAKAGSSRGEQPIKGVFKGLDRPITVAPSQRRISDGPGIRRVAQTKRTMSKLYKNERRIKGSNPPKKEKR